MPEPVHGHEVMKMMIEASAPFTRNSLREAILARFGEGASFYTCSAENMTPDELMDFLEARGKFVDTDNGFTTDKSKICNH
jgi:probable metal-binding protein